MKKIIVFICLGLLFTLSLHASKHTQHKRKMGYYRIKSGDSLSVVARRFKTTTRRLISLNHLKSTKVRVGQRILVPNIDSLKSSKAKKRNHKKSRKVVAKRTKSSKKEKKFIKYKVDKGDTIAYIARRFHLTRKEVAVINGLDMYKLPKTGKILKLPNYKYWSNKRARLKELNLDAVAKANKPKFYKVERGDTLFSIARKFKTQISDLRKLNNLEATEVLRVGRELKIPSKSYSDIAVAEARKSKVETTKVEKTAQKSSKSDKEEKFYTIKRGDTIPKIAKKVGVSTKELMRLNKLTYKSRLQAGKKLLIAKGVSSSKKSTDQDNLENEDREDSRVKIYTVKSGDTLWGIAKKHNLTIKELKALNDLGNRDMILDGMKLVISKNAKNRKEVEIASKSKKSIKKRVVSKKEKRKTTIKVAKNSHKKKTKTKVVLNKNSKKVRFTILDIQNKHSKVSVNKIIRTAKRYLGTRYVWGAEGPKGFDCSGFTQYVMRKSKGVNIPRVSRRQAYYGKYVSRQNLKPGDLIFFDTSKRRRGYVNHVGIYIGNNKFIHASSAKHRVVITSLNRPFYRARFKWGRRIN